MSGFAGGFASSLASGSSIGEAFGAGLKGGGLGLVMGATTRGVQALDDGIDPFSGKPLNAAPSQTQTNATPQNKQWRTEPTSLEEQIALKDALAGGGQEIMKGKINDNRFQPQDGWEKRSVTQQVLEGFGKGIDGSRPIYKTIEIHYWYNRNTNQVYLTPPDGPKFKNPPYGNKK